MPQLTARPQPIELDPSRTAVVVVDMQNAFASPGGMFDLAGHDISGAPGAIAATGRLLAAARAAGVPVIYLQMGFAPDLADAGDPDSPAYHKELALILMRERPALLGKLLVRGTWDWQIVDALRPEPSDIVLAKTRYDGFTRTGLDAQLRALGVRNLLFAGIATNICVESTARHAFFLEYWPILVEDAVNAAGPDFTRLSSLWAFENVFGWVTTSAAVAEALGQGARAAAE
ncbi:MAG TPA: cysteine hydrolase [Devosia sp.]|nr:cysteine hydrolase [Devosia sp.]